jgi:hypothetical protein
MFTRTKEQVVCVSANCQGESVIGLMPLPTCRGNVMAATHMFRFLEAWFIHSTSHGMFHTHPQYSVGAFVSSTRSIEFIDELTETNDKCFDFDGGLNHLNLVDSNADGILYFP